HDNGTDGGWQVDGIIMVTNPNLFDVADVDVSSDTVDNGGGSCNVTDSLPVTVPGSGSVDLHYTCTYPSTGPTSPTGTNTAVVTWPDIGSLHTSVTATALFDFGTVPTSIIDGSVNVTDTLGGTLGTAYYSDPNPTSFIYSHTFGGDTAGTCTGHDNKATFTPNNSGTTGDASQSVTVCVGKDLAVRKDATPAFRRTYNWTISKAVDKTLVEQI